MISSMYKSARRVEVPGCVRIQVTTWLNTRETMNIRSASLKWAMEMTDIRGLPAEVSGAMLALAVSVGHRTGLYDALAELDPATSDEIAERTGLQERYIREWLSAQAAAGYVTYEPATGRYAMTEEQALALAGAS